DHDKEFLNRSFFEPCAGNGAIINRLRHHGVSNVSWVEINQELAEKTSGIICSDYFKYEVPDVKFDYCFTNPPYKLAEEFAKKAISHCHCVVLLLRLGFLASQK